MSRFADNEPVCEGITIQSRPRDLGDFVVRRTLPSAARRTVGPFIFFDHLGPVEFAPGRGMDVRPHPHIALATITYLFEGEILHRDNLGSVQAIRPGDVNWMLAGRGIAHSERSSPEVRARGGRLHGLQTWVALPKADEEHEPRFEHHAKETLPIVERPGVVMRVVAGTAYGAKAAVGVLSPTLYVHATCEAGASLEVTDEHPSVPCTSRRAPSSSQGRGWTWGRWWCFPRKRRPRFERPSDPT
jgi:redox-sensitive bicupin YhaK (pirin superfamily)